jgi:diacylglycerol kinase (ATP)
MEHSNLLFVINPHAGGKNKVEITSEIQRCCRGRSLYPHVYETTGKNDETEIQQLMQQLQPQAIIAVGGDGTVNLVGNLLLNSEVALGIIPAGSANGLAKDLHIPLDFEKALDVVQNFHTKKIDTLKINGRNCFHLSDLGFNARVVHKFAESNFRGKITYFWYALKEFFTYKFFAYKIHSPELKTKGKAFMMVFSNANKFGTNITINPVGVINDGFFEISIIKPFPKIFAPIILLQLISNTISKSRYFKLFRLRKATISNSWKELIHIDGEPVRENSKKLEVEVMPQSLKVILPNSDPNTSV